MTGLLVAMGVAGLVLLYVAFASAVGRGLRRSREAHEAVWPGDVGRDFDYDWPREKR